MATVEPTPGKANNNRGITEAIVKATYEAAGSAETLSDQILGRLSPSTKADLVALADVNEIYLNILRMANSDAEHHLSYADFAVLIGLTAQRDQAVKAFGAGIRSLVKETYDERALSRLQEFINKNGTVAAAETTSNSRAPGDAINGNPDNVGGGGGGGGPTAAAAGDEAAADEEVAGHDVDVGAVAGGEGRGGGDYDKLVERLRSKDEENASLSEQLQNALQKNEQLEQKNKQLEQKNNLLQVDNNQLREGNASLKTALGAVETTINCFGNLENRVAKMEDKQDELGDQFEEFGEDVDNLRTDVDYVTASHEELDGKVDAEIERREEKEYEMDDNMWKLSKEVEENHDYVGETADNLRREWEEENETLNAARNDAALDHFNEAFAAEMDDQNVNVHKVQNDLLNQQEQLDVVVAFMEETKQAEHRRQAERRRRSF